MVKISVNILGQETRGESHWPAIDQSGRYVAFQSAAVDLVGDDTNNAWDVFVRDCQQSVTALASISSDSPAQQANGPCGRCAIGVKGTTIRVYFESDATNLPGPGTNDTLGYTDIFVRDITSIQTGAGSTYLISKNTSGGFADGPSLMGSCSQNGDYVGFYTWATNMRYNPTPPGTPLPDTNKRADVYVRDRNQSRTYLGSVNSSGANSGSGHSIYPSVVTLGTYPDGTIFTAFSSGATDLVSGDSNLQMDVFLHTQAMNWGSG